MFEDSEYSEQYYEILIIYILFLLLTLSLLALSSIIIDIESKNPDATVLIETNNTTKEAKVTVLRNENVNNFIIADKGDKSSKKLLDPTVESSKKLNLGSKSGSVIVASNVSGSHKIIKTRNYNFN